MPPKPSLSRTGTSTSKDLKPDKVAKPVTAAQPAKSDVKVNLVLDALKDAPPVVALPQPDVSIEHSEQDIHQLHESGAIVDSSLLRIPAAYATTPLVQFMRSDFKWVMQSLGDSFYETLAKAFEHVSIAPLDAVASAKNVLQFCAIQCCETSRCWLDARPRADAQQRMLPPLVQAVVAHGSKLTQTRASALYDAIAACCMYNDTNQNILVTNTAFVTQALKDTEDRTLDRLLGSALNCFAALLCSSSYPILSALKLETVFLSAMQHFQDSTRDVVTNALALACKCCPEFSRAFFKQKHAASACALMMISTNDSTPEAALLVLSTHLKVLALDKQPETEVNLSNAFSQKLCGLDVYKAASHLAARSSASLSAALTAFYLAMVKAGNDAATAICDNDSEVLKPLMCVFYLPMDFDQSQRNVCDLFRILVKKVKTATTSLEDVGIMMHITSAIPKLVEKIDELKVSLEEARGYYDADLRVVALLSSYLNLLLTMCKRSEKYKTASHELGLCNIIRRLEVLSDAQIQYPLPQYEDVRSMTNEILAACMANKRPEKEEWGFLLERNPKNVFEKLATVVGTSGVSNASAFWLRHAMMGNKALRESFNTEHEWIQGLPKVLKDSDASTASKKAAAYGNTIASLASLRHMQWPSVLLLEDNTPSANLELDCRSAMAAFTRGGILPALVNETVEAGSSALISRRNESIGRALHSLCFNYPSGLAAAQRSSCIKVLPPLIKSINFSYGNGEAVGLGLGLAGCCRGSESNAIQFAKEQGVQACVSVIKKASAAVDRMETLGAICYGLAGAALCGTNWDGPNWDAFGDRERSHMACAMVQDEWAKDGAAVAPLLVQVIMNGCTHVASKGMDGGHVPTGLDWRTAVGAMGACRAIGALSYNHKTNKAVFILAGALSAATMFLTHSPSNDAAAAATFCLACLASDRDEVSGFPRVANSSSVAESLAKSVLEASTAMSQAGGASPKKAGSAVDRLSRQSSVSSPKGSKATLDTLSVLEAAMISLQGQGTIAACGAAQGFIYQLYSSCAPLRWSVAKSLRLAAINSNCIVSDASQCGLLDALQDMLLSWTSSLGVVAVGEVAMVVAGIAGALDGEGLSSGIVSSETGILNAIVTVVLSVTANPSAALSNIGLESLGKCILAASALLKWPVPRHHLLQAKFLQSILPLLDHKNPVLVANTLYCFQQAASSGNGAFIVAETGVLTRASQLLSCADSGVLTQSAMLLATVGRLAARRPMIASLSTLPPLMRGLRSQASGKVPWACASCLGVLMRNPVIGAEVVTRGGLPMLLALMDRPRAKGIQSPKAVSTLAAMAAVQALRCLGRDKRTAVPLLREGALDAILSTMKETKVPYVLRGACAACLGLWSEIPAWQEHIVASDCVPVVVKMLGSKFPDEIAKAAQCLASMCRSSTVLDSVMKLGCANAVVALLQGDKITVALLAGVAVLIRSLCSSNKAASALVKVGITSAIMPLISRPSKRISGAACKCIAAISLSTAGRNAFIADPSIMKSVVHVLQSSVGGGSFQGAAESLAMLCTTAEAAQVAVDGGVMPTLLKALAVPGDISNAAAAALSRLAVIPTVVDQILQSPMGGSPFVGLLTDSDPGVAARGCAIMEHFGSSSNGVQFVIDAGCIDPLVSLTQSIDVALRVKAIQAVACLACSSHARIAFFNSHVIPSLAALCCSHNLELRRVALIAMCNLCAEPCNMRGAAEYGVVDSLCGLISDCANGGFAQESVAHCAGAVLRNCAALDTNRSKLNSPLFFSITQTCVNTLDAAVKRLTINADLEAEWPKIVAAGAAVAACAHALTGCCGNNMQLNAPRKSALEDLGFVQLMMQPLRTVTFLCGWLCSDSAKRLTIPEHFPVMEKSFTFLSACKQQNSCTFSCFSRVLETLGAVSGSPHTIANMTQDQNSVAQDITRVATELLCICRSPEMAKMAWGSPLALLFMNTLPLGTWTTRTVTVANKTDADEKTVSGPFMALSSLARIIRGRDACADVATDCRLQYVCYEVLVKNFGFCDPPPPPPIIKKEEPKKKLVRGATAKASLTSSPGGTPKGKSGAAAATEQIEIPTVNPVEVMFSEMSAAAALTLLGAIGQLPLLPRDKIDFAPTPIVTKADKAAADLAAVEAAALVAAAEAEAAKQAKRLARSQTTVSPPKPVPKVAPKSSKATVGKKPPQTVAELDEEIAAAAKAAEDAAKLAVQHTVNQAIIIQCVDWLVRAKQRSMSYTCWCIYGLCKTDLTMRQELIDKDIVTYLGRQFVKAEKKADSMKMRAVAAALSSLCISSDAQWQASKTGIIPALASSLKTAQPSAVSVCALALSRIARNRSLNQSCAAHEVTLSVARFVDPGIAIEVQIGGSELIFALSRLHRSVVDMTHAGCAKYLSETLALPLMSLRQASLHPGKGVTLLGKSCAAKALSRMCSAHEAREAACGAGAVQGIINTLISMRDNLDANDPFTCEACLWLCYCLASLFRNAACLGICCRQQTLHPIVNLLHRRFPLGVRLAACAAVRLLAGHKHGKRLLLDAGAVEALCDILQQPVEIDEHLGMRPVLLNTVTYPLLDTDMLVSVSDLEAHCAAALAQLMLDAHAHALCLRAGIAPTLVSYIGIYGRSGKGFRDMDSTPQPLSSTSADLDSLVSVWEQACQTVEAVVTASVATCGVQVELSQIPEGEIPELDEILAKFNLSVSQAARALHSMALGRCVEALASCAETTEGCQAVVAADAIDVVQKCISCSWSDGKNFKASQIDSFHSHSLCRAPPRGQDFTACSIETVVQRGKGRQLPRQFSAVWRRAHFGPHFAVDVAG